MSLAFYGQWVISGVVEEKNNRVVELILSAVRPHHLLAGKVIGIGLLGFGQLALVAGLAAGLLVAGVFDASRARRRHGTRDPVVRARVRALRRGVRRRRRARLEPAESRHGRPAGHLHTPRRLLRRVCGAVGRPGGPAGERPHCLSPLSAPLVLPARSALVGVPLWEHALAVVLVLGSIYALVRFAGRVYGLGLLHGGPTLGVRAAWRLARHA